MLGKRIRLFLMASSRREVVLRCTIHHFSNPPSRFSGLDRRFIVPVSKIRLLGFLALDFRKNVGFSLVERFHLSRDCPVILFFSRQWLRRASGDVLYSMVYSRLHCPRRRRFSGADDQFRPTVDFSFTPLRPATDL